jgi:predicted dehydrogenase
MKSDAVVMAQIGCGYWGPNLLRNLVANKKCRVKWVAEQDPGRSTYVKDNYPSVMVTDNWHAAILDSDVEAVVIATPATTHFALAKAVLEAGRHVFVEKPLAMSTDEAEELVELARDKEKKLFVGHTFIYNSAVKKVKELIDSGELGDIYYIFGQRLNLGKVRSDVNALWNLAPHDISIALYWFGEEPDHVSARGMQFLQEGIEDVVFLNLDFPSGRYAHIHVSWLDPHKVRKFVLVGSKKMLVYDDVSSDARIILYDKGIDKKTMHKPMEPFDSFGQFQLMQRSGDIIIPHLNFREPLSTQIEHFLNCIINDTVPDTDGHEGLRVVRVLEAAQASLRKYF